MAFIIQFIYVATGILFFLQAFSMFVSLYLSRRVPLKARQPADDFDWPSVTLQLPVFNEPRVTARLLDAITRLDYPLERLSIQILDDSTDETSALIDGYLPEMRARGYSIEVVRRPERNGYKAGALCYGMARIHSDLIGVIDADFAPHPDFLKQMVPHFAHRSDVAFVQARWGYLNARQNLTTLFQSYLLDLHFVVQKPSEQQGDMLINYNGSAGIWRREVVERLGGWSLEAPSEDLEMTYRAWVQGLKGLYLPWVEAPGELPPEYWVYQMQQERWSFGRFQVLLMYLERIWKGKQPLPERLYAMMMPAGYGLFALALLQLAILPPVVWLYNLPQWPAAGLLALIVSQMFAILIAQKRLYPDWLKRSRALPLFFPMIIGLLFADLLGFVKAVQRKPYIFRRTPKYGVSDLSTNGEGFGKAASEPRLRGMLVLEVAVGLYALLGLTLAVRSSAWVAALVLLCVFVSVGWNAYQGEKRYNGFNRIR